MDEVRSSLEKEYCPPIDPPTFRAILSDFDISAPSGLCAARDILNVIKSSAETEESTGFDPSGTSNLPGLNSTPGSPDVSGSWNGDLASKTDDTDAPSLTRSAESGSLDGSARSQYDPGIDQLSSDDKLDLLAEGFPDLDHVEIKLALSHYRENFGHALDELLTRNLLRNGDNSDGEPYVIPKGIDGFAVELNPRRSHKSKNKSKRRGRSPVHLRSDSSSKSTSDASNSVSNKWQRAERDVDFVSQRTKVPSSTVSSLYHQVGMSLSSTILGLCQPKYTSNLGVSDTDTILLSNATQLHEEFPVIQLTHLIGIARLTHPSMAAAHELAKALIESPFSDPDRLTTETTIIPHYTRPSASADLPSDSPFTPVRRAKTRSSATELDYETASGLAADFNSARSAAFAQASASYRRSKSDRAMSGAASYYSSVARDAKAFADAYSSMAADALVAHQSSGDHVDLHGVDVQNAVRIARSMVEEWWRLGQAEWAREGRAMGGGGFKIITGIGKHSQGGIAKLGPAVRKALVRDGWRVDEASGEMTVSGKMRGKG